MGQLKVEHPVPSDIVIAQATKPIHIAEVAKSIGLEPDAYDLYGTTKAKASVFLAALPGGQPPPMHAHATVLTSALHCLQVKLNVAEQARFCPRRKLR